MKKPGAMLVLPVLVLLVAGCGGSKSGATTTTTTTTAPQETGAPGTGATTKTVTVSSKTLPKLGPVLVNGEGKTLYVFAPDKGKKVTCVSSCAAVWPPLKATTGQKAKSSGGVKSSKLGSATDPEGGSVVTYAGWPLYTYVADTGPGSARGQALNLNGGYWYVMSPAGKIIK